MHIPFPQELISSVPRWLAQYRLSQGMSMEIPTRKIVTTYASLLGWGAYLQGELVWGLWSLIKIKHSINWLELRAIWLALAHFQCCTILTFLWEQTTWWQRPLSIGRGYTFQNTHDGGLSAALLGRGSREVPEGGTSGGLSQHNCRLALTPSCKQHRMAPTPGSGDGCSPAHMASSSPLRVSTLAGHASISIKGKAPKSKGNSGGAPLAKNAHAF